MFSQIAFSPLIDTTLLLVISAIVALGIILSAWRGLSGWWLRALAAAALICALANPVFQQEEREALSNVVFLITDASESQQIANRPDRIAEAVDGLRAKIGALESFELKEIQFENDPSERDDGSLVLTTLKRASAEVAQNRIAGAIIISDGRIHDQAVLEEFPAPVHVLLTGEPKDWDRKLTVQKAPAFAIMDEEVTLNLRIDTLGAVPASENGTVKLEISIDGEDPLVFQVDQNKDLSLPLKLRHGGLNVLQFTVAEGVNELTARNNSAVISMNGVRDRLRVLLVSGAPYAGGRTWRNLLKSDASVDLVHFTILRSPDKLHSVPVRELSLIAFPTRELFIEKIDDFDLIIFDRFRRFGLLRNTYFENVVTYVENGGAVLFAAGPDFSGVNSIYRTEVFPIIPVEPTAQVIEEGFRPKISDIGKRHPVTQGLENFAPSLDENGDPEWGRWLRLIESNAISGNVVMTGVDEKPLLVLDRVGEGRVAALMSDHAWLWARGYEGGGPQLELLRRVAHWSMQEPELEEEQLSVEVQGSSVTITRRSLDDETKPFTIIDPEGEEQIVEPEQTQPGLWQYSFVGDENGLYKISDGALSAAAGVGPVAPREFENAIASDELLAPLALATNAAVMRLSEIAVPNIRLVREGRSAAGRNWLGLTPRNAFQTLNIRQMPLLPAWAWLLLAAALSVLAWWREGR